MKTKKFKRILEKHFFAVPQMKRAGSVVYFVVYFNGEKVLIKGSSPESREPNCYCKVNEAFQKGEMLHFVIKNSKSIHRNKYARCVKVTCVDIIKENS